jgi:hypothetical protein
MPAIVHPTLVLISHIIELWIVLIEKLSEEAQNESNKDIGGLEQGSGNWGKLPQKG